jgi:hypothetical protein
MRIFLLLCVLWSWANAAFAQQSPALTLGTFKDDYGIRYTVSDTLWIQHPKTKYRILSWNTAEQYLIAQNDALNPSDGGLYTRIDYLRLEGMQPFEWGFCLTAYAAASPAAAEATPPANRQNPRKGCNGFPFSRMKRTD